jgi:putative acetyltransferase
MDNAEFIIRVARPDSLDIAPLIAALSRELAELYDHIDDGSGKYQLGDAFAPRSALLLGYFNDRAVACGAFRPFTDRIAEIKRMYVLPEYRGRKYAAAMLAKLEELVWQAGFDEAWLETGDRCTAAIQLYDRSGYRRIPKYGIYERSGRSVCFGKLAPPTESTPANG